MRALLSPQLPLSSSSPAAGGGSRSPTPAASSAAFPAVDRRRGWWRGSSPRSAAVRAAADSATIDHLEVPDSEARNPSLSPSYRAARLRKPNQTVLEAQARVCTGPTQTRPLSEDQAFKVLDTILRSGQRRSRIRGLFLDEFALLVICVGTWIFRVWFGLRPLA